MTRASDKRFNQNPQIPSSSETKTEEYSKEFINITKNNNYQEHWSEQVKQYPVV